jgi:hypothetical protein
MRQSSPESVERTGGADLGSGDLVVDPLINRATALASSSEMRRQLGIGERARELLQQRARDDQLELTLLPTRTART